MDKFKEKAIEFVNSLEYRKEPYSSKSWGNNWHSLCSYHGKLKPAIAYFLIKDFTKKGDVILDPLCGVGTIPFEACLNGRVGIGNDLSELAYVVSKAKLEKVKKNDAEKVVKQLNDFIEDIKNSQELKNEIESNRNFGFNSKVSQYFHSRTYKEILSTRIFFKNKVKKITAAEAMVLSCMLHILHGNRPYALSRKSHPLTPYAPTGDLVYKNVIEHINNKLDLTYKKMDFNNYVKGKAILGDYSYLIKKNIKVDCIITSPPFADSMRFYMQNWMRLWFCGWNEDDFKNADNKFIDKKQIKNFDIYYSFFEMCDKVLLSKGKVILHLGKTDRIDMAKELSMRAKELFNTVYVGTEDVDYLEKHGIKDKGGTTAHQFLFLRKKY